MSKRAPRNRPPRLDDLPEVRQSGPEPTSSGPTLRRRLVDARITGLHARFGRQQVEHALARLALGDPASSLGLDLGAVRPTEGWAAVAAGWGWSGDGPRASIDPELTIAAARALGERLLEVSAAGGKVAFATARPAALLPLMTRLVKAARDAGAIVLECDRYGPLDPDRKPARWLWWHHGVAMVTDGESLLGEVGPDAGPEWLFAVGRPDLVVADHGFAGAAIAAGHETFAFADLDAPALGVAAHRIPTVRLVPVDESCPPPAYDALLGAIFPPPSLPAPVLITDPTPAASLLSSDLPTAGTSSDPGVSLDNSGLGDLRS